MIVKFIRNCPWSFSATSKRGILTNFKAGEVRTIASDIEARSMIDNGYAEIHVPIEVKKTSVLLSTDRQKRFALYMEKFSRDELKQFCKEHHITLRYTDGRTKSLIIEIILDFEEELGQITWS